MAEEEVAQLPPNDEVEVEVNLEGFQQILRELHTAFGSGLGSNADIPRCTEVLHLIACYLEKAEEDYKLFPGRSPYVNLRGDHLVGTLIRDLLMNEEILYEVVLALFMGPHQDARIAAARVLLAASHLYSDKAPPVIFQMFHEEAAFEHLASWVTENTSRPRIVFGLGLLAVILVDREIADYIVRSNIAQTLLQSLRGPILYNFLFGSSEERAKAVASLPFEPLPGLPNGELLAREIQYSLNCLALMGEYQEILSPFFQEDGMELIMTFLKQHQDLDILFSSIEFVSRLLAHKKVAMAFVQGGGVEVLLHITQLEQVSKLHGVLALCLFGLASLSNVMEAVCRLPNPHFSRFVMYGISLLSFPQEHTQKHAVLFFSLALTFRPVLEAFDDNDGQGLYCLLNILRTSPNGISQQRRGQLAHYTCLCLRHYLRIHLALHASGPQSSTGPGVKAGVKRPRPTGQEALGPQHAIGSSSYYKPVEVDDSATDAILNAVKSGSTTIGEDWFPLGRMLHNRGILVLLGVVASASTGRTGAAETAKFAFDCLEILTLHPSTLTEACLEEVLEHRTGVQILLEAASGLVQRDAEVMKGALRVLCNCLRWNSNNNQSRGITRMSSGGGGITPAGEHHAEASPEEKVRRLICKSIRKENGIKVLVSLLRYRRCIQAADEVRMLATTALSGLAHESQIAQILEKMRLSLVLSEVVRAGPVMERSSEHYKTLRAAATQLIARITGRPTSTVSHSEAMDPAAWKLEKAAIVARTPISYESRELLVLIRDHLLSQGLFKAARTLEEEAELGIQRPSLPLSSSSLPITSPPCSRATSGDIIHTEGGKVPTQSSPWESPPARLPKRARSSMEPPPDVASKASGTTTTPSVANNKMTPAPAPATDSFCSPLPAPSLSRSRSLEQVTPASSTDSKAPPPFVSGSTSELTRSNSRHAPRLFPVGLSFRRRSSTSRAALQTPSFMDVLSPDKMMTGAAADALSNAETPIPTSHVLGLQTPYLGQSSSMVDTSSLAGTSTTLDQIVVQYLRTQHEKCPDPICVLPPFSLTLPHHCPEAVPIGASRNVCKRIMQRQICPPYGGRRGAKATRSLIFSRFRPWRSYRDEESHTITVSAFHRGENKLWVGTSPGCIRLVNLWTMEAENSWDCHQFPVTSISISSGLHRSPVVLTSGHLYDQGGWQAETMIWGADDLTTPLLRLPDLRSPIFDTTSTRVAGLSPNNMGEVYDAETGSRLRQLVSMQGDAVLTTQYKNPNICFSLRDDHILLTDGCLWDLRTSSLIHRFDKLSNGGFGAFSPNGNEVIIDNSVWDLRSYNLLKMTGLDQCQIQFSAFGDVIYGFRRVPMDDIDVFQGRKRTREYSSFTVLDGLDYSLIHTQELDKQVMDLAVDHADMHLAVVETNMMAPMDDNVCRLYEVGRQRPNEADSDIDDAHSDSGDDDDDWDGAGDDEEEEDDDSNGEGDLEQGGDDDDEDHDSEDEDELGSEGGDEEDGMEIGEEELHPLTAQLLGLAEEELDDEEFDEEEDTEDDDDDDDDDEEDE